MGIRLCGGMEEDRIAILAVRLRQTFRFGPGDPDACSMVHFFPVSTLGRNCLLRVSIAKCKLPLPVGEDALRHMNAEMNIETSLRSFSKRVTSTGAHTLPKDFRISNLRNKNNLKPI